MTDRSWSVSGYTPEVFPYSNVQILDLWRWKHIFRFKKGKHLDKHTYVFDDLLGITYKENNGIHFITKNHVFQCEITTICNSVGINHGVMWEGPETQWYHVILYKHRLEHRMIRVLRAKGFKVTRYGIKTYLVLPNS